MTGAPADPASILRGARRIAVVGFSATPGKDAHEIPKYLLEHGFDVVPVNPTAPEILGRKAYASLAEVPGEIDIVNVFRPAEEAPEIARAAARKGARAVAADGPCKRGGRPHRARVRNGLRRERLRARHASPAALRHYCATAQ